MLCSFDIYSQFLDRLTFLSSNFETYFRVERFNIAIYQLFRKFNMYWLFCFIGAIVAVHGGERHQYEQLDEHIRVENWKNINFDHQRELFQNVTY